jgi:hypothetical protein
MSESQSPEECHRELTLRLQHAMPTIRTMVRLSVQKKIAGLLSGARDNEQRLRVLLLIERVSLRRRSKPLSSIDYQPQVGNPIDRLSSALEVLRLLDPDQAQVISEKASQAVPYEHIEIILLKAEELAVQLTAKRNSQ